MDLSKGFQIEQPDVFVPWNITEDRFQEAFRSLDLRRVTDGYLVAHCTSLGGLSHELGFHFYPRGSGRLSELEFFCVSNIDLSVSYQQLQRHLENTFGPATVTAPGQDGYLSHTWSFAGAEIVHFVQERFGPEEHVRIRRSN